MWKKARFRADVEKRMSQGALLKFGISLAALAAAGCVSVSEDRLDGQLPEPPAAWASETADAAIANAPVGDWLAPFGDNQLYVLVDEAMRRNNTLLAAAENLKASQAGARVTRASLFPTLNASGSASRNAIVTDPSLAAQAGGGGGGVSGLSAKQLETQFGVDADNNGQLDGLDLNGDGIAEAPLPNRRIYINNYGLTGQVSWEIDLWGRLVDETRAAYRDARSAQADLAAARLSIAGGVANSWFALIEARQQRELGERDVAARDRNLQATERRYQSGVASSLDVRLSRSALGVSRANLALRRRLEKEGARRLEVLLGRYPAAELAAAETLPALPAIFSRGGLTLLRPKRGWSRPACARALRAKLCCRD
jgi:outer membrane protein TolC